MPDETSRGYPYPLSTDPVAISADMQALAEAVDGDINQGYLFSERLVFTSDDTFEKANFPGLRAINVIVQGAGGAGGGAPTTNSPEVSVSGGGGGGCWISAWLLEADIDSTVPIVVGTGGTGDFSSGDSGTASEFAQTFPRNIVAEPGEGGQNSGAVSGIGHGAGGNAGGPGNIASEAFGVVIRHGDDGTTGIAQDGIIGHVGHGGASLFGGSRRSFTSAFGSDGRDAGVNHRGAGGSGAFNYSSQGTLRTGGSGSDGLVIVDVYV